MKESRDHDEIDPSTAAASSAVEVVSPSSPHAQMSRCGWNGSDRCSPASPSGTGRHRAYGADDEKQRYIDAIRDRMTQRDQDGNPTRRSLNVAIEATERLRTRNNSEDIAEKLGHRIPSPLIAAEDPSSKAIPLEEAKDEVGSSNDGPPEHRDHVWGRSVSRMFRRKSMEMDRLDANSGTENGDAELRQEQPPTQPTQTATGRRRNQIARSERPGAVHMSGRAFGGLPAWARRRMEQERLRQLRQMDASTVQGNAPPIRDPTLPNNMIQVGTERMLPEEANVEEIFACDQFAQVVVDATNIETSEAFDKMVDDKHQIMRKRQLRRAAFVCSLGTALIVTVVVYLSTKYAPRAITVVPTFSPTLSPTSSIPSQVPSSPPTDSRRAQAFGVASAVTAVEDLTSDDSPQHRAMDWILFDDEMQRSPGDPRFLQRYIMATFYFATDGENWLPRDGTNFLSGEDECHWFGTTCDENGHIVALDMNTPTKAVIGGTFPSEIARLEDLQRFNVVAMNVGGTIPTGFGTFARKLKVLSLFRNQLVAPFPDTFANHSRLEEIHLTGNRYFGGSLPSVLGSIPNIRHVNMIRCNLTGTIATELGDMINLEKLEINENQLSGTIPLELHKLEKLWLLNMTKNDLTGPIPLELYSGWKNLQSLHLSNNRLSGRIPDAVGKLSSNTSERKSIDLSHNNLNGPVPSGFGDIDRLSKLLLQNNSFTGTVPQAICDLRENPAGLFFTLNDLEADCGTSRKDVGEVKCACCTKCHGTNDW